jgi:hypothetical protein
MRIIERIEFKFYRSVLLLLAFGIFFLSACQKPSISFGNSFVANNNTNIVVLDSSTVQLSTVALDSFSTAGSGAILLGRYNDAEFGTITSKTFLQIGIPGAQTVTNQAGFDSIALIMHINKTFYADTTVVQRYYVSQLDDIIQYPSSTQRSFYNNSSLTYNPSPLGYTDVSISPTAVHSSQNAFDSVKIRLNDTLGQRLLVMLQNRSDTITNLNTFLNYFKGITIYSDTNAPHIGTMYGFKDSVVMRLYYHEPGVVTNFKFIDFPYNNKAYQFNQISVDRSGTPLAIIKNLQATRPNPLLPVEAPSTSTNNEVFVQGATGIQTKIIFPYILNILGFTDYIGVYKAQLILKPINTTFSPELALAPQLLLSTTDQNNQVGAAVYYNNAIQYGNLFVDYTYGANTSYSYDVTSFIKQQLALGYNTNGLMLSVPANLANTTFNRSVFGDNTNKNYTINLKIYYISLVH